MKTLIASAVLLASTSSFAHDTSFSNDSCDVELVAGIKLDSAQIAFSKNDNDLFTIKNGDSLYIGGVEQSLSSYQQNLVSQYDESIRAILPEAKVMALDAIDLAVDGVNMAFDELLGEGNTVGQELTAQLTIIKEEVDTKFNSDASFYIDENGISGGDIFGPEFEQRIEQAIESTIQNSMGSLLIAVGQELLFSGGGAEAIETRMENFGKQIETEMEARGEALGKKAEQLCESVKAIDNLEEALKAEFDSLKSVEILTVHESAKNKA